MSHVVKKCLWFLSLLNENIPRNLQNADSGSLGTQYNHSIFSLAYLGSLFFAYTYGGGGGVRACVP